jgi:hypothetical protein
MEKLLTVGKELTEKTDVVVTPAAVEVASSPTLATGAEEAATEAISVWLALVSPEYKVGPGTM